MSQFGETVAADLKANIGSTGWRRGFAAFVFHPGFATILLHRCAVELRRRGHHRLANLVWRWNVTRSGCHLHLESSIGAGCYLPHPTAIVIGAGVTVGAGARIYQGVTLGKAAFREAYPTLGDDVTVFPNAIIVGDLDIGDRAVVGALSLVTLSVPAGAVVAGNPATVIRSGQGVTSLETEATSG